MLTFALVVLIILCAWLLIGLSVGNNDESAENTDELKREFGFEQISIKCRGFVSNGDGSYQYCVKLRLILSHEQEHRVREIGFQSYRAICFHPSGDEISLAELQDGCHADLKNKEEAELLMRSCKRGIEEFGKLLRDWRRPEPPPRREQFRSVGGRS